MTGSKIAFADENGLYILDVASKRARPIEMQPNVCVGYGTCQEIDWQPAT